MTIKMILSLLIFLLWNVYSVSAASLDTLGATSTQHSSFMAGGIQIGESAKFVSSVKIDAALALIMQSMPNHKYISKRTVDSVASLKISGGDTSVTYSLLAQELQAETIIYVRVNALQSILRADISLVKAGEQQPFSEGFGYAFISYMNTSNNTPVADPALLRALQRALLQAWGNDTAFLHLPPPYNVRPTKPLVVGSLVFIDTLNSERLLFKNKVENSYAIITEIATSLRSHPALTVYDTDSRDSLYAQFRFYFPENYLPMSGREMDALFRAGVEYVITGSIVNKDNTGILTIVLCSVQRGGCKELRRKEIILKEKDLFLRTVQKKAGELALQLLNEETQIAVTQAIPAVNKKKRKK